MPPIHPRLPELLDHLGLKIVDAVKWNVLLCRPVAAGQGEAALILKYGSDERKAASMEYEVRVLRDVLPQIDQQYFERLVLPEYVNDGTFAGLRWSLTRYIKGMPLLFEWSELSSKPEVLGGRGIGLQVARYAVDVLRDLRVVDVENLPPFVRRFNFDHWHEEFRRRSQELVARGLVMAETVERANELFTATGTERYQGNLFTNGDFYPRNFILLPEGRIAVADWVGGVDPWEFVAMKCWIMMWGNPDWQRAYVKELAKHFPIDVEEMQVGLLVKCANRIWLWRDLPEEHIGFARSQLLTYFSRCLDIRFVEDIFEGR